VPSNVTAKQGGSTYNNFDTNPNFYIHNLVIDSPEVARDKTMMYAGRMFGGDLQWTFNNSVDDFSNAVNIPLRNMLTNYTSSVSCIQGQSSQTLSVPFNHVQTLPSGANLTPMVFVWGGTATDVIVNGLPANGISFTKNMVAKTVTISGNPTETTFFTVTTTGTSGLPIMGSGTVTVGLPAGNEIHNFTASAFNSNFYQFVSSNMNGNLGNVNFEGLNLRARLTLEAATQILYTTHYPSTLTLVFESGFSGTVRLNNVNHTASGGVAVIPNVPPGNHVITRGGSTNLFYIRTAYATLNVNQINENAITLYPNPTTDYLYVDKGLQEVNIESIHIFNLTGQLVSRYGNVQSMYVGNLPSGLYIVEMKTQEGAFKKKFIKR
jgi:pectate lyase